jgi:hypothetical protein
MLISSVAAGGAEVEGCAEDRRGIVGIDRRITAAIEPPLF